MPNHIFQVLTDLINHGVSEFYFSFFFVNCFTFCIFKNISLCSHVLDIKFASIIFDLSITISYNEDVTLLL